MDAQVSPSAGPAHAIVSLAAMLPLAGSSLTGRPAIACTGLGPAFLRATGTEELLSGRDLLAEDVVPGALLLAAQEAAVDGSDPHQAGAAYRRGLVR
jgi:hypothetical protein